MKELTTEDFLQKDEWGRLNGILPYNKPQGEGSHDIVYKTRRHLQTKTVGHGGALDPFAEGLLLILVGKATKQFDNLLILDKEYIAEVIFGVKSQTLDPESSMMSDLEIPNFSQSEILENLKTFTGEYNQRVPVFSSVKVKGRKLREVVSKHKYEIENRGSDYFLKFDNQELQLPVKQVKVYESELISLTQISKEELLEKTNKLRSKNNMLKNKEFNDEINSKSFQVAKIRIRVSKGTYIRQFAEDLASQLHQGTSGILLSLVRTSIGDYHIDRSISF